MFLRDVIVEFAVVKYLAPDLFDFPCQTFASYSYILLSSLKYSYMCTRS